MARAQARARERVSDGESPNVLRMWRWPVAVGCSFCCVQSEPCDLRAHLSEDLPEDFLDVELPPHGAIRDHDDNPVSIIPLDLS